MPILPFARPAGVDWRLVFEDIYGLIVAAIMLATGAYLLCVGHITTGGTVGLSLLLAGLAAISYGMLFAAMNVPLFVLGWRWMGTMFTAKSLAVTAMTAGLMTAMPQLLVVSNLNPILSALAGGTLVGMGALAAPRHGAGAGGTLVIVLWLQKHYRVNAGLAQLCFDLLIILLGAILLDPVSAAWSAAGVIATDAMIITWHRTPAQHAGSKAVGLDATR
ncbi:YitT family protein [Sphingomonas sp. AP4-R1]|uniref:YitT family protein n=1 Tax=Sphingomonas sp. AP4-R1 TaxID=2735134 RepID=UPI0014937386|nr:YitT family protein [Sphingomonas sp. AP4-R1]QJU59174.1 YitT family protein [Sphingomonas sp. AP4-R1]